MNILSKFPRPYDPTPLQIDVLNRLTKVFEDKNKKFVIIQAPTGTGKSFISRTLGNTTKEASEDYQELVRSYDVFKRNGTGLANEDQILAEKPFGCTVLTITKTLQDQYEDLFMDTDIFKGKSNYQCALDETKDVEIAVCRVAKNQRAQCWREKCCEYYEARNEAILSTFSCLNYKVFLTLRKASLCVMKLLS
jgi:Rad3-related DNA helicase